MITQKYLLFLLSEYQAINFDNREKPQYVVTHDGDYLLIIHIEGEADKNFEATVEIDMIGDHGYLSIVDWPLLPFYGLMCGLYVAMGLGWLVVCSLHWRDILKIQFWIGAVIFLGKVREKKYFFMVRKEEQ